MNSNIRVEEYHLVGAVTLKEFHADLNDFVDFSADYDDPFETNFTTAVANATGIATSKFYISELSALTDKLEKEVGLIYRKLNFLERYIKLAKNNLSKKPNLFGIKAVRNQARKGNIEGLVIAFANLFANVEVAADFAAIKAKGLTDASYTELKDLANKISQDNITQEFYKTEKATAIEANWVVFDGLLNIIKDVQETGKTLYKGVSKAKTDAYTMSVLLDRVRQEQNAVMAEAVKEKGTCAVYVNCDDEDGNPLEDLTVTVVQYGLKVQTDEDGTGYFEEVSNDPDDTVDILVEGDGFVSQTKKGIKLEAGGQVDVDVVMVAAASSGDSGTTTTTGDS